jgi:SHS2 domain-containing protein
MRQYSISDRYTTADIGLELEADSLNDLFAAAAEGMFSIIMGQKKSGAVTKAKTISLQASSLEQLMVDWLSELLYLFDAEDLVAVDSRIEIHPAGKARHLEARVNFLEFDGDSDIAEHEIKAVTYYKLNIVEESGEFQCHVVFDL